MKEDMEGDMEERNILLFQMSMLKTKPEPPVNHYYYEEKVQTTDERKTIRFHFDGQSQLEPGTKYLIYKLAGEEKKIDRIIVLNTDETVKTGDNNSISAYNYYCEKMNEFWEMIRNTYENGSSECKITESKMIEACIPKTTIEALSGFASADIDSNAFGERGLIDTIESSIRNAINEYCKQIKNRSDEKKKKGLVEFEALKEIVGDLVDIIKKEIEDRFDKMSGLASDDGYNAIEHMVKEDIDAVPVDQLEKMELTELFKRFQKYASEVESLGNTGKLFLKKGNREIWFRYLLSKLSYYYKKEYYEKKGIREEADFYQKRAEVAEKKADFYQKRAEVAEKKARILEQQSDYYKNNIRQHLTTFIREYAYYYCLENNLLLYENKQEMKTRKALVYEKYYPKSTSSNRVQEAAIETQESPIQIDTVNIVNDDLNSALFDLKKRLDTIQQEMESKEESIVRLNIYIDMQGGDRSGAFLFSSVLKLIDSKTMFVKEQFATNFVPQRISHQVVDKTRQYDVEKLSSGMNAFLRYGRADELCVYLEKMDPDGKNKDFVETIQKLGNAISICDPEEFEKELKIISATKNKTEKKSVFDLLIGEFDREFEPLLKKGANVLDRIEWFLNKGFTQQALTYIEAKMPNYIASNFVKYELYQNGQQQPITKISEIRDSLDAKKYESNQYDIFVNRSFEKYLKIWKKQQIKETKTEGSALNDKLKELLKKCGCIKEDYLTKDYPTEDVIKQCILHYCDDHNNRKMCNEPKIQILQVCKWINQRNQKNQKKKSVSKEELDKIKSIETKIYDRMSNTHSLFTLIGVQELFELLDDKNWTVDCMCSEDGSVNRYKKWCKDYLIKRSIDILCNGEKVFPDNKIPTERGFWKNVENGISNSNLASSLTAYKQNYDSWKELYEKPTENNSSEIRETAFVGFRAMMDDRWVKAELDNSNKPGFFENGKLSQATLKRFFSNTWGDGFYRLIFGNIPENVIEVIKSANSVDLPLEDNKHLEITLRNNPDENKKQTLRKFFRLHSAFRKERNSTNHASETDIRTPYEILNDMIRLYIQYARELTQPTPPKTQLND